MAIPDYETLMLPMLQTLSDGVERRLKEVRDLIADRFHLSEDEREKRIPSGYATLITNRVGWAKTYLQNVGLVEVPTRGRVRITKLGQKVIAQNPNHVDAEFLEQFPSFVEFKNKSKTSSSSNEPVADQPSRQEHTPLEVLDASYRVLQRATSEELLARLKRCSPAFFEHVVVKLLLAMGYGGGSGEGLVTKKTGDAGIDGVITEDKLGLDVVCVQAKKWEGSVGRPVVQAFVGSMDYIRAKKGVIIATSHFSPDALDFVNKIEGKKVVLVDGDRLAELMLEHDVGVTTTNTYKLKERSEDFFSEDEE
jgi:restriction system protein